MALKVLSALDAAKVQLYHFKAIIVAGMGLFTDAYDLFCIPPIIKLLGRIYYHQEHDRTGLQPSENEATGSIPNTVISALVAIALLGTVIGKLVFGRLGDRVGRRRVYGLSLTMMVLSSIACGFSICRSRNCVFVSLGFFRFLLGIGIGGDYPLSATIMSEFANRRTRGAFIAAVFSMQGFGILASSIVTMIVCKIFEKSSPSALANGHTPEEADIAWRIILMLGAIPAALTCYWRMMMPETARYTALVKQNVLQAAMDMTRVLDVSMSQISGESQILPSNSNTQSYPLLSKRFFHRHGYDLFSCSANWFLLDFVFYSSNLFQSQIYHHYIEDKNKPMNGYQLAFKVAIFQAILSICSTIPGYWVAVYFIDRIGRVKIQMIGFSLMAMVYFAIGIPYKGYWSEHVNYGFMVLYGMTFFFANFGPNTTTFIVPAELFPARFRSTCHGISGAVGKVGAMVGTVSFLWASTNRDDGKPDPKRMTLVLVFLGVVCIVGVLVTYFFTPETMGRSLEENENENDGESESSFSLATSGRSGSTLRMLPSSSIHNQPATTVA